MQNISKISLYSRDITFQNLSAELLEYYFNVQRYSEDNKVKVRAKLNFLLGTLIQDERTKYSAKKRRIELPKNGQ